MPSSLKINFFFEDSSPYLKDRQKLKVFISSIFKHEKRKVESVSFIFSNDETIKGINKRFLNHNFFTDVITFNLSGRNLPIAGEIYISCERVKENSKIHKTTFKEELHRVIFHGVLHLCGYKDKTSKEMKKIRDKEGFYLSKYFEWCFT